MNVILVSQEFVFGGQLFLWACKDGHLPHVFVEKVGEREIQEAALVEHSGDIDVKAICTCSIGGKKIRIAKVDVDHPALLVNTSQLKGQDLFARMKTYEWTA